MCICVSFVCLSFAGHRDVMRPFSMAQCDMGFALHTALWLGGFGLKRKAEDPPRHSAPTSSKVEGSARFQGCRA